MFSRKERHGLMLWLKYKTNSIGDSKQSIQSSDNNCTCKNKKKSVNNLVFLCQFAYKFCFKQIISSDMDEILNPRCSIVILNITFYQ